MDASNLDLSDSSSRSGTLRHRDRCYSYSNRACRADGVTIEPVCMSWPRAQCITCDMFVPPRSRHVEYVPQSAFFDAIRDYIPGRYPNNFYNDKGEPIAVIFDAYEANMRRLFFRTTYEIERFDPIAEALKVRPDIPPGVQPGTPIKPPNPVPPERAVYYPQSHLVEGGSQPATDTHPVMDFVSEIVQPENGLHQKRDNSYYDADQSEVSLNEFLSRPIRIGTFTWTPGIPFVALPQNVYSLFFSNPRNINRLAGYRYMKADLCVSFLINGTSFHYGCILASAWIRPFNDSYAGQTSGFVIASQRPHVMLTPSNATGGCLRLPMATSHNGISIVPDPFDLSRTVYAINFDELVPLAHTNAVTDPVTITMMAWAENVVLAAPTALNPIGYVPQSGEYGKGVISKPAATLAHMAGKLTNAPYIGRYMLATSMFSNATAVVASAFGYSKPVIVSDYVKALHRTAPNMASANEHEPIHKLALDEKQEVTIDPTVTGFESKDEMTLSSIVTKEAIMTVFTYPQAAPVNQVLFQGLVTPMLYNIANFTPSTNISFDMVPMCWMGAAMTNWRGTIIYRFRCIKSAFHRGRLKIAHEPSSILAVTQDNVNNSVIWDISEQDEIEVAVGWANYWPYLQCRVLEPTLAGTFANPYTITSSGAPVPLVTNGFYENGILTLSVINELNVPQALASPPVGIVVSVRAGDDFEFYGPTDRCIKRIRYTPQSGHAGGRDGRDQSGTSQSAYTFEKAQNLHYLGPKLTSPMSVICHGDPVVSLRVLLKRYMFEGAYVMVATANSSYRLIMSAFPYQPGKWPGGKDTPAAGGTIQANQVNMTFLAYFSPGYFAQRGGLRNRYRWYDKIGALPDNFTVTRIPEAAYVSGASPLAAAGVSAVVGHTFNGGNQWYGATGRVIQPVGNVATLDAEIPHVNNTRFRYSRTVDPSIALQSHVQIGCHFKAAATAVLDRYVSAADDFSLINFIGVPRTYFASAALAA